MAKTRVNLTCETCGATYAHAAGGRGRPPKHCPDHRKTRGRSRARDTATRERAAARQRTKRRGQSAAAVRAELDQALQLAAAMAVYKRPADAARWVGLELDADRLARLVKLAKTHHGDIVAGEPRALSERLLAAMHLIAQAAVSQREAIAPRDLPHVLRAFAQARELTAPPVSSSYAEIHVGIIGADGAPISRGDK